MRSVVEHRRKNTIHRVALGSTMCFFMLFSGLTASADGIKDTLLALAKDPNPKTAFRKIAESENPKIIAALGVMFFDGIAVSVNHREAMPYLQKAADLNRPEAQYRLGLAYSTYNGSFPQAQNFYNDPPADMALAEQWFRKAANSAQEAQLKRDPAAITTLGHLYQDGKGGISKDLATAKRLFLDAAKQGYPDAEVSYAALVDLRRPINPGNLKECLNWYTEAAKDGSSEGFEGLGLTYLETGEREKARPLLKQAASLGREPASRFLYLHFKEKVGDNIASEMDKEFEARRKIRDVHDLMEKLSDPVVIAGIIVGLSAVIGIAAYNPDIPEAEQDRRSKEYEQKEFKRRQEAEQQRLHDLDLDEARSRLNCAVYGLC
jgi:TPR repeat protein